MIKLELHGLDPFELDTMLEEFPSIKPHIETSPLTSIAEDQEIGLVNATIELAPHVLDLAAALLSFLAARYAFVRRNEEDNNGAAD